LKILLSSHAFAPSIGGIETVSALLAQEFSHLEHQVVVVTQTSGEGSEEFHFPVVRQPSLGKLFDLIRWCDVFWQNNLSLRTVWPAFVLPKPVVITHQGSYCAQPMGIDLPLRFKRAIANRATSVAISQFVAGCFSARSSIIPNPYDARHFAQPSHASARSNDLLFVGRLVAEKGLDLLIDALVRLRSRGLQPRLTIVGSGPELTAMQKLSENLGLRDQVKFAGPKLGAELVEIFRQHKILVVPSRYDEPFGVVALEGIAGGCVVVGSSGGGLPEAIGPCGVTFPNGDVERLAGAIEELLRTPDNRDRFLAKAPEHLARFHPASIANQYLELFQSKRQ
jgi:glycogen(starch) synthase